MQFEIDHTTRYTYHSIVSESYNEVRLNPVSDATQECHEFELLVDPKVPIERYHDFHRNAVDHFYILGPHERLVIRALSRVSTLAPPGSFLDASFPMNQVRELGRLERCYDFLQASEYVSLNVEVWRQAQDLAQGHDDLVRVVIAFMEHIHREFTYEPGATTVETHVEEVLRQRRGVCQDFAHAMIALCRSLAIPCRYVSGYLYSGPGESLRGDLATHAWVEVFLPELGWCGLDPTNNRRADEHHVKVAVGRDYADAAPIRGNFRGQARQEMSVELRIRRLDDLSRSGSLEAGTVPDN